MGLTKHPSFTGLCRIESGAGPMISLGVMRDVTINMSLAAQLRSMIKIDQVMLWLLRMNLKAMASKSLDR